MWGTTALANLILGVGSHRQNPDHQSCGLTRKGSPSFLVKRSTVWNRPLPIAGWQSQSELRMEQVHVMPIVVVRHIARVAQQLDLGSQAVHTMPVNGASPTKPFWWISESGAV